MHESMLPDSAIDPQVTSPSGLRCKPTSVSRLVVKLPQSIQLSLGSPNTLCL